MRKNMQSNTVKSIHFDTTYSCVPPTPKRLRLLVLSGFDEHLNKTFIGCFILIQDEKTDTFLEIFKTLTEEIYKLNPTYMMSDFAIGQIKACQKIFPNCLFNGCFFHWTQSIWKKFQDYGLGGKGTYIFNITLLFNLQVLCFIKRDKVPSLYKKIKNKFDINDNTEKFFNYFKNNWLGKRYPLKIWNYYDRLNLASNNSLSRYITTNNLNENINRFLNQGLKRGKTSFENFLESIKNVYIQFEEKTQNKFMDNTKTKILEFYCKKVELERNSDFVVLSNEEIENLKVLYNDLEFEKVNGPYNENQEGEPFLNHLAYDSEFDLDGDNSSSED